MRKTIINVLKCMGIALLTMITASIFFYMMQDFTDLLLRTIPLLHMGVD